MDASSPNWFQSWAVVTHENLEKSFHFLVHVCEYFYLTVLVNLIPLKLIVSVDYNDRIWKKKLRMKIPYWSRTLSPLGSHLLYLKSSCAFILNFLCYHTASSLLRSLAPQGQVIENTLSIHPFSQLLQWWL